MLELQNAAFGHRGKAAASAITMRLAPGEAVAVVGSNGSGKSTLLNGLVGITEHLGGTVKVCGTTIHAARGRVGMLPQRDSRNLLLPVTVAQVIGMGLYRSLGLRPFTRATRARVQEAAAQVGLENRLSLPFSSLSGGQQQRAILARALVNQPQLLLLDEPFNGLDHPSRQALLNTVQNLRTAGCAIMVSTHDLEIAHAVCTHVLLLDHQMIAFGSLATTLTVPNLARAFHDTTVNLDGHAVTTRHESAEHLHRTHSATKNPEYGVSRDLG